MPFRLPSHRRPLTRVLLAGLCGLISLSAPLASTLTATGASAGPVTVQELCLLLHGGYTGDEVLRETAGRPLLEPLDAAAQQTLRAAGADQHLLDTLRSARPTLTDDQAAALRQQQAAAQARDMESRAAYQSRMLAANKQAFETQQAVRHDNALGRMAGGFHGKLVAFRDGRLQPCDDSVTANKKLFAFYFSALWCGPCRKFTPQLVQFYNDFAPKHPDFELVFVSKDHTAYDMENYMRQDNMPWPALAFDREAGEHNLMELGTKGIPRLVLFDGTGKLLSDSYEGEKYLGPQHVLEDLVKLVSTGNH